MQSENAVRKNRISQNRSIVWLTAFILTILVIATVSVVGMCIYRYANRSDCQISLYDGQVKKEVVNTKNAASQQKADPVIKSQAIQYSGEQAVQQAKSSEFKTDDVKQLWKTETAIDLFKSEYKNANGVVTVKSADGSNIVAPGTEGSYTFSLKNTSDMATDYKVWMEADLSTNITGVPIEVRISSDNGWLVGDKNNWVRSDSLNDVEATERVSAGKATEYTVYWQWPFEQGDDETDTSLANASASSSTTTSVEQKMSYTMTIYTLATATTEDDNPNAGNNSNTGNDSNADNDSNTGNDQTQSQYSVKTGDNTQILLWMVALIFSAGLLTCLLILKKRENSGKNEQNKSEQ